MYYSEVPQVGQPSRSDQLFQGSKIYSYAQEMDRVKYQNEITNPFSIERWCELCWCVNRKVPVHNRQLFHTG
jgi:hypothetical protein